MMMVVVMMMTMTTTMMAMAAMMMMVNMIMVMVVMMTVILMVMMMVVMMTSTTTTMTMTTIVIMLFTVATDPPPGWDAAAQGYRSGRATTSHSCNYIRGVPNHLRSSAVMKPSGLSNFYQKYTEAYGIPVLGRYLCQLSVQLLPEVHRSLWNTCVR